MGTDNLRFSRSTAYAIQALTELTKSDQPLANPTLAERNNIPERFLSQVMRKLVNAQIVESVKGGQGGYLLADPDPTFLRITEAVDGPITAEYAAARLLKPKQQARIKTIYTDLVQRIRDELDKHRLSEIIDC